MGEIRKDNASLFDCFLDVLGQLGIEIEVDKERDGVEEITRRFDEFHTQEIGDTGYSRTNGDVMNSQRSRRASFDALNKGNPDRSEQPGKNFPQKARKRHKRSTSRASESQIGQQYQSKWHGGQDSHLKVNVRAASDNYYKGTRQDRSIQNISNENLSLHNVGEWRDQSNTSETNKYYVSPIDLDANEHIYNCDDNLGYDPVLAWDYVSSDRQILQDAESFLDHRIALLSRRLLWRWRTSALESSKQHNIMYKGAQAYDRNILLRQGWDQWRARIVDQEQEKETERFFDQLALRAGKARDLFLMTKAFTHWAQSASDEILRTSVARRHILRTKYFNAWRDVTAVNELKVRRQGLSKYFGIWRHHAAVEKASNIRAQAFRDDKAVQTHYWRWFWKFCEFRAPQWAAGRLKRNTFYRWATFAFQLREREQWVIRLESHNVQELVLQTWQSHLRRLIEQKVKANKFRRQGLCSKSLNVLKIQSKLLPSLAQTSAARANRMKRNTLQMWCWGTRASLKANEIRQLTLVRNTWTDWNDRLRCSALSFRIDERVMADNFNAWVRQSKCALLIRIREKNTLKICLSFWITKVQMRNQRALRAEMTFSKRHENYLLRANFYRWKDATMARGRRQAVALSIYSNRSNRRTLVEWEQRYSQLRAFDRQACDAQYYLTCKHAIRQWHSATQSARKWRRREAYATVRRRVKCYLLKQVFEAWKSRLFDVSSQVEKAEQHKEQKTARHARRVIRFWYEHLAYSHHMAAMAMNQYSTRLLLRSARLLKAKYADILLLSSRASEFGRDIDASIAIAMLKKLNWQAFQVERQNESAAALKERNQEKHYRIMLRYWAEKATSAQRNKYPPQKMVDERPSIRNDGVTKLEDEAIAKAEDWSALDTDLHLDLSLFPKTSDATAATAVAAEAGISTSTPLPGYLRTPSKRTARTKSRFRFLDHGSKRLPFTPVTAPVRSRAADNLKAAITPFQQKLREQGYSERRFGGNKRAGMPSLWNDRQHAAETGYSVMRGSIIDEFDDIIKDEDSKEDPDVKNETNL